jgi:outer membrane receptor for ferrienterochelin and colicins
MPSASASASRPRRQLPARIAFMLFSALAVSGAPPAGAAQDAPRAGLAGVVRDPQGGAIPGATVIVRRAGDPGAPRLLDTEWDGRFAVALAPGEYEIEVRAAGFGAVTRAIAVPAGTELTLTLQPAAVVEDVRVVSASRQEELRQTLNTRVDVLTRTRIEESGADTVAEALRELPGVLTRRGSEGAGAGGEQIQGLDSRQVLVLVDGLPLVGARGVKRGGVLNLDRQTVGSLERIEVVKGAASALYGSDAMGGVINLITRRSTAPLSVGATVAGGSRGDLDLGVETGFRRGAWSGLFLAERHELDGFDLTPSTFDTTGAPYERTDGFAKAGWTPRGDFSITGLVTGYRNHTTGRSLGELGPQEDDIRDSTLNASAAAAWQASPGTSFELRVHHARFDEEALGRLAPPASTPLEPGALEERFTRIAASVSQVVGSRQHLQAGLEHSQDRYAGINRLRDETGEEVWTGTAWAQHRIVFGAATATAGVRVDRHSIFGTAVSPKLAVNVRAADNVSVRASYGRGFRAPDVGQLYYRFMSPSNFYQVVGNPRLEPEYANSFQLGADAVFAARRARIGVNLFRNDVRDLIDSVSLGFIASPAQLQAVIAREGLDPSSRPVFGRLLLTYRNIADAVTQGVEVDGEFAVAPDLVLGGAYTFLDARDEAGGLDLTGRHRHHGHVRASWGRERIGLRANLRGTFLSSWIAARATAGGVVTDTVAPGFALWDAYVSQRVRSGLVAFVALDNLADSQDPNTGVLLPDGTAASIHRPEAGRSIRVGVKWTWAR